MSKSWLTSQRLRAHATILMLCLWGLYVWTLATPGLRDHNGNLKGTDFLHFYTLGTLAIEHRGADLYDMNAQSALAARRVPAAAGIRYLPLYPPQVSLLYAPFAHFSYGWALAFWWACSTLICGVCCYAIWRGCPHLQNYAGTVTILALAFPAFFHLIAWGQTSALVLACFTIMYFLLRGERAFAAGLVLGCLIFKPQLGLAAAIVFVAIGAWKIAAGAILSATAQLSVGVLYYGMQPLREWMRRMLHVNSVFPLLEPKPYQTHSLRTFWTLLLPWQTLSFTAYLLTAALVLGLTISCWRRAQSPLGLKYSSLLLATVLVAPHLTVYDLVILVPAILLLADWILSQPPRSSTLWLGYILYLIYALPLLGPLARFTHVQISVLAMVAGVYLVWRIEFYDPDSKDPNRNFNASGNLLAHADS
jgi:alpha-1,2-mannosyltransferase